MILLQRETDRAEARAALANLQNLIVAIPAALDNSSGVKGNYTKREKKLLARCNGLAATGDDKPARRWSVSKTKTPKRRPSA
ncbi:hypothetical protein OPIT5_08370 [Opitutaceae bacterium TAV5]|nr:hypothetical protein OPIT5_08370 [Opitutaceae bacterium TAV5]